MIWIWNDLFLNFIFIINGATYLDNESSCRRYHVLHDVSQVRWVEKNRRIVVNIQDSDDYFGLVVSRNSSNFRRAIFPSNCKTISRFTFEIQIFRNSDYSAIFRDCEIPVFISNCYTVTNSTVGSFVAICCWNLSPIYSY